MYELQKCYTHELPFQSIHKVCWLPTASLFFLIKISEVSSIFSTRINPTSKVSCVCFERSWRLHYRRIFYIVQGMCTVILRKSFCKWQKENSILSQLSDQWPRGKRRWFFFSQEKLTITLTFCVSYFCPVCVYICLFFVIHHNTCLFLYLEEKLTEMKAFQLLH